MSLSLTRILERITPRSDADLAKIADAEKRRETERHSRDLAVLLGARYSPERSSLEAFEVAHPHEQRPIIDRLKALDVKALVDAGRGLIFFGPVGTGKDHLLAAMLYRAAAIGFSCAWINGQEFYGHFRDRIDTQESEAGYLHSLSRAQVLAISDPVPPAGAPTAWNIQQFYRLVDRRYRAMKSTWVSLNVASQDDADQMLSAPAWDRLRDDAEIFRCFWPSWRKQRNYL